jgi:hypothetical protein
MHKDKGRARLLHVMTVFSSLWTQLTFCFPAVNQFIFQFFQHTMLSSEVTFLVVEMTVFILFYGNNSLEKETNDINMI